MERDLKISTKIDWLLILLYLVIVGLGYLNLYSSDYQATVGSDSFVSSTYGRQLLWIGASVLIAFFIMLVDTIVFSMFAYVIYVAVLSILLLVFVVGMATHGARSWIEIGNIKIQPSEFAKFATALALARFISINEFKFNFNNVINIVVSIGIIFFPVILILLQPDVGSAIVYVAFVFVLFREGLPGIFLWYMLAMIIVFVLALVVNMLVLISIITVIVLFFLFVEVKDKKRLLISLIIPIIAFAILFVLIFYLQISVLQVALISLIIWGIYLSFVYIGKKQPTIYIVLAFLFSALLVQFTTKYAFNEILQPHQRNRIEVLFDNSIDPKGIGYNLRQSKIAIGSGGIVGKGYLKGTQTKLDFVPEHNTDFIYCTVAEEWGFRGTVVLFILYGTLLVRIILKAEKQMSPISRIYGYGVASILFIHFFVNIGMTIGLLPVIGIPLPFFSYGGSAMLGFTILLFIFIKLDTERNLKL